MWQTATISVSNYMHYKYFGHIIVPVHSIRATFLTKNPGQACVGITLWIRDTQSDTTDEKSILNHVCETWAMSAWLFSSRLTSTVKLQITMTRNRSTKTTYTWSCMSSVCDSREKMYVSNVGREWPELISDKHRCMHASGMSLEKKTVGIKIGSKITRNNQQLQCSNHAW